MLNAAQTLFQSFFAAGARLGFDYRHPAANRGTPKRLRFDRREARRRDEDAYQRGLAEPQPIKYLHSQARRRALEAVAARKAAQ